MPYDLVPRRPRPEDPLERDARIRHRRVKIVVTLLILTGVALLVGGAAYWGAPSVFLAAFVFGLTHELVKAVFGKGSR